MSKKHVGIFGTWNLNFWAMPEEVFQAKLEKNPIHPFTETTPDHFEVTLRSPWLWMSLICLIGTSIVTVCNYATNPLDQSLTYFIMAIMVFLYSTFVYSDLRRIVIDTTRHEYEFHVGSRLVYRGHIHNVYIRLVGQKSGEWSSSQCTQSVSLVVYYMILKQSHISPWCTPLLPLPRLYLTWVWSLAKGQDMVEWLLYDFCLFIQQLSKNVPSQFPLWFIRW